MATSKVPDVIDALVAKFSAAVDLTQVVVKDGPYENLAGDKDVILVGHDGAEDDTSGSAASSDEEWVGLGTNNRRDEPITVTCSVLSWRGDNSPKTARDRAYALVTDCENAILADTTLGIGTPGTPGSVRNALVSGNELFHSNNAAGAKARVVLTVTCIARL